MTLGLKTAQKGKKNLRTFAQPAFHQINSEKLTLQVVGLEPEGNQNVTLRHTSRQLLTFFYNKPESDVFKIQLRFANFSKHLFRFLSPVFSHFIPSSLAYLNKLSDTRSCGNPAAQTLLLLLFTFKTVVL